MCRSAKENHVSVQAVDYTDLKRKDFEIMRYSTFRKIKFRLCLLTFKLSWLKFKLSLLELRTKFRLSLLKLKTMRLRFIKPRVS